MIYVLKVSKNGHFLNPPHQRNYEWSLHDYVFDDLLEKKNVLTPSESLDLSITSGQRIFLIDLVYIDLYLFDDLLVKNILF